MCVQRDREVLRPGMASPDVPSPSVEKDDAGFCSGGEDDDSEESNRSNSDDSGLKMGLKSIINNNINNTTTAATNLINIKKAIEINATGIGKRKTAQYPSSAPLKKRIRFDVEEADRRWPEERVPPPHEDKSKFFSVDALLAVGEAPAPAPPPPRREQRNYKNMTRERRIEANARERTRVHTISAAFDTLRRSIPAYSHNQKLSKLSVLRIACSYILALSKVAAGDDDDDGDGDGDGDEGGGGGEPTLAECVESVSRTIQTEGKLRKRRDDV